MANHQPFYHRMEILFTAKEDVSEYANSSEFKRNLADFLKKHLRAIKHTVNYDSPVDAEPGDPADLM
jgi:hypothetical protein